MNIARFLIEPFIQGAEHFKQAWNNEESCRTLTLSQRIGLIVLGIIEMIPVINYAIGSIDRNLIFKSSIVHIKLNNKTEETETLEIKSIFSTDNNEEKPLSGKHIPTEKTESPIYDPSGLYKNWGSTPIINTMVNEVISPKEEKELGERNTQEVILGSNLANQALDHPETPLKALISKINEPALETLNNRIEEPKISKIGNIPSHYYQLFLDREETDETLKEDVENKEELSPSQNKEQSPSEKEEEASTNSLQQSTQNKSDLKSTEEKETKEQTTISQNDRSERVRDYLKSKETAITPEKKKGNWKETALSIAKVGAFLALGLAIGLTGGLLLAPLFAFGGKGTQQGSSDLEKPSMKPHKFIPIVPNRQDLSPITNQKNPAQEKHIDPLSQLRHPLFHKASENRSLLQLQALVDSPVQKIDDKLYQHILGSYFGKNTGLEGYNDLEMMTYLLNLLKNKVTSLNDNPLCDEKSRNEFCRSFFQIGKKDVSTDLFQKLVNQTETALRISDAMNTQEFASVFRKTLNRLKPEESFFFQSGWTNVNGGHSIVYEVIKQKDGNYTFRAFNRGAGTQYHPKALFQGQRQLLPFHERVDIPKNHLTGDPFLFALQEIRLPPIRGEEWKEDELYEKVFPHLLGGRVSDNLYSSDQVLQTLRVGHCSYLSMNALVSQHLGDKPTYSRWQLEVELKTLLDYFSQKKTELSSNEQTRRLLKYGVEQLSRNIKNGFLSGLITEQEQSWIHNQIQKVDLAVKEAEKIYQNHLSQRPEQVVLSHPILPLNTMISCPDKRFNGTWTPPEISYVAVDKSSWHYKPETFKEDLSHFLQEIESANSQKQFVNIKEGIKQFVLKIPFEGDVFWKGITKKEAETSLELLAQLSEKYLDGYFRALKKNEVFGLSDPGLTSEDFIASIKILTLADALAKNFKGEFGYEINGLNLPEIMEVLEEDTIYVYSQSPSYVEEMRSLRHYWRQQDPKEEWRTRDTSFFGFEHDNNSPGDHRYIFESKEDTKYAPINLFGPKIRYTWPDIEFAKKWITKTEDQFDQLYPDLASLTIFQKACISLSDKISMERSNDPSENMISIEGNQKLLPAPFFSLRKIAMAAHLIGRGTEIPYFVDRATDLPYLVVTATRYFSNGKPQWRINYVYEGLTEPRRGYDAFPIAGTAMFIAPEVRLRQAKSFSDPNPFIGGYKTQEVFSHELEPIKRKGFRKRISAHEKLIVDLITQGKSAEFTDIDSLTVSTNSTRPEAIELLSLSSNPTLQIQDTFSHFSKKQQSLLQKSNQELFRFLMNEKGLLTDEIFRSKEHASSFTKKLADFCHEGIDQYQKMSVTFQSLYFLKLNQEFRALVDHLHENQPEKFLENFVNPFKDHCPLLNKMVEDPTLPNQNRSFAAYLLIKTYSNKTQLSDQEVITIFKAKVQWFKSPLSIFSSKEWNSEEAIDENELLVKLRAPLQKVLDGKERDNVLQQIVNYLNPKASIVHWDENSKFPFFYSKDHRTVIDVMKGHYFIEGLGNTFIPQSILENKVFISLFGKQDQLYAGQTGVNWYALNDKEGHPVRIEFRLDKTTSYEEIIIVEREIEGKWYQGVTAELALAPSFPAHFIKENMILWIGEPDNPQIWVTEGKSDLFKYRIEGRYEESKIQDGLIHRLDTEKKDMGEFLSLSTQYPFLMRFEDPRYTLVWNKHTTHQTTHIELPRFRLNFDMSFEKGLPKIACREMPGYRLASSQFIPALGDVSTYLLLQKEGSNQQVVLIPRVPLHPLKEQPLFTNTAIDTLDQKAEGSLEYFAYAINEKTGELIPPNDEARFHLAMIALWERDYEKAMDHLRGYHFQREPLSKKEMEILLWIAGLHQSNRDESPHAVTVRLFAHFLGVQNQVDRSVDSQSLLKTLKGNYNKYLRIHAETGVLELSPDEEALIINYLIHSDPMLELGVKIAKGTSWEIIQREFSLLSEDQLPKILQKALSDLFEKKITFLDLFSNKMNLFLRLKTIAPSEYAQKYKEIDVPEDAFTQEKTLRGSKIENVRSSQFIESIKPKEKPAKPSLLRSSLSSRFQSYYELIKKGDKEGFMSNFLMDHTGIEPSNKTTEEKTRETVQLLWFLKNQLPSHEEKLAASFLGAAFQAENLHEFPTAQSLTSPEEWSKFNNGSPYWYVPEGYFDKYVGRPARGWDPNITSPSSNQPSDQPVITQPKVYPLDLSVSSSRNECTAPFPLQTCLRDVSNPMTLVSPVFTGVDDYLIKEVKNDKSQVEIKKKIKQLKNIFNPPLNDRIAKQKFADLIKELTDYGESLPSETHSLRIKDIQAMHHLKTTIEEQVKELEELLSEHKVFLETLADKTNPDPNEESHRRLKIIAGDEKPITISDLLQLFRKRDRELYYQRNPALTPEDIDKLNAEIKKFLIISVEIQQKKRLADSISQIEKNYSEQGSLELDSAVEEFAAIAKIQRQYAIEQSPEYLNLEETVQFILRKDQIDNLKLMKKSTQRGCTDQKNGIALEAIPGSGKTSVLLTLQALNDADGETLPIIVMPEALMPSMSKELQERLGDAFEQSIETMEFDRDSQFNEWNLQRLVDRFDQMIKQKKALLITDNSIQSLVLKFVEEVISFAEAPERVPLTKLSLFRKIFAVFRKSGKVTIDEMDLILNVLKAHHFTLGEPQQANNDLLQASTDFYTLLATNDQIKTRVKLPFLSGSKGVPFDPVLYQTEVKPLIIEAMMKGDISSDKEVKKFFSNLNSEEKILVAAYLNNTDDQKKGTIFINKLPSKHLKNLLAVWKEVINTLFPLTAKKELNEHYGSLPKSENGYAEKGYLAIPFRSSNHPVVRAMFGTDLEIILYTIQMFLDKGISEEIVRKEITQLQSQAIKDIKTTKLQESEAYQAFVKLCGGKEFPFFKLNEEHIRAIIEIVNVTPVGQMDLIRRYALSQLKVYPKQLHTNGQIYGALFNMVSGFSGTLLNADSFPNIFINPIQFSDTMAKTLHILWENSPKTVEAVPVSGLPIEKMVSALYSRKKGFKGSFADAGGIFRDVENNSVVAEEILKQQPSSIKGVAFYDHNNRLVVLIRGQILPIALSQCGLGKEEICVYWDQQHTTGSDIKLGMQMTATVSVGQHTMIRDLIQAAWRMRGLEKGQKVDFVVAEEDGEIIRNTIVRIGSPPGEKLELKDLLVYTLYNQSMRQGDDNYRSLKQKMQMVLINKAMAAIADPSIGDQEAISILIKLQELFVIKVSEEPFDQYGEISTSDSKERVMQEELDHLLSSRAINVFKTDPILSKRYPFDLLKSELKDLVNLEIKKIPDHILKTSSYGNELHVKTETKTQTETQKETQKETEKEQQLEIYGGEGIATVPRPVLTWDNQILFDKSTYKSSPVGLLKVTMLTSKDLSSFKHQQLSPVVSISDVFSNEPILTPYQDIFDSSLRATLNMMPIYARSTNEQPIYHPFGKYQDIVSYLIVTKDNEGKLTAILADQADAVQIDDLLKKDAKKPLPQQRNCQVCLYNLQNGIVQQGAEPFNEKTLEQDPAFIKLKAQAKFFGGFVNYSEEELQALEQWIQEKGKQRMHALFETFILNNKPEESKMFSKTKLGKLLK